MLQNVRFSAPDRSTRRISDKELCCFGRIFANLQPHSESQ